MNLQPITASRIEQQFPKLYAGYDVGRCVNPQPNGRECGQLVRAADGFADLDGTPFKAYYCVHCARSLLNLN
jgi:hypothetical protein